MTSHPVGETVEWFESYSKKEYARMGASATQDITLPEGESPRPSLHTGMLASSRDIQSFCHPV
jgi:hypothetical protein